MTNSSVTLKSQQLKIYLNNPNVELYQKKRALLYYLRKLKIPLDILWADRGEQFERINQIIFFIKDINRNSFELKQITYLRVPTIFIYIFIFQSPIYIFLFPVFKQLAFESIQFAK